jgi:hypothetical protein
LVDSIALAKNGKPVVGVMTTALISSLQPVGSYLR